MDQRPFGSVEDLIHALHAVEHDPGHDVVPVLQHLLQCADLLAERLADLEVQVAGLVHDLGGAAYFGAGDEDHASRSADLVRPLLGPRVADLVAGHVDAKRYLVATDPGYLAGLSHDSTSTLAVQGGAMTPDEVAAFAARRDRDALVALRRADDEAKVPGRSAPDLEHWRAVIEALAR